MTTSIQWRALYTLVNLDVLSSYAHSCLVLDIQANNLLLRTSDSSIFRQQWEEEELREPSLRKITASGHIIYQSHSFRPSVNIQDSARSLAGLVLSDLGEARIGLQQRGLAQPDLYRAPEIILGMPWGPQVDTWSIAVMARLFVYDVYHSIYSYLDIVQIWDFFFKTHMFRNKGPDGKPSLAHHLAEMVALLGPPPLKFLQRSEKSLQFWDEQGKSSHTFIILQMVMVIKVSGEDWYPFRPNITWMLQSALSRKKPGPHLFASFGKA